ncbi:MAG: tRNA uridine-5-carboxymethylaminomethyl(34) synthesis GTPase MnmE [Brevinema sp.]
MLSSKIIAAPATAAGVAGVSMIRVSGEKCIEATDRIFRGSKSLSQKKGNEIAYGHIINPDTDKIIDEVLVGVFHKPYSFTGEESLEIWVHGSPYVVKEVMHLLTRFCDASLAEPGEFSMRAFLNGKIDLTQAEAIRDLTESQTKFAHAQAIGRLNGGLSQKIHQMHKETLDLLALLEMAIDHAEDEHMDGFAPRYLQLIEALINQSEKMLSGASVGKMSTDGVKVVLVGRPNVGKSSLLNALVDEDRVIVSNIAGTTRDVIEHRVSAKGLLIRFFDTAGLRETDDVLEKEGTLRSLKAIESGDLICHIMDQSEEMTAEDKEIAEKISSFNKPTIQILNKSDLPQKLSIDLGQKTISVSAQQKDGVDAIFDAIYEFYSSGGIDPENDVLIANVRQEKLLTEAKESLLNAKNSIHHEESEEFTAAHVRKARIFLEEIVGKTNDDAILDRIFSQFCIGK